MVSHQMKLTPDELGKKLWGDLTDNKMKVNSHWLAEVHRALRVGGIWAWPATQRNFVKIDADHFEESE
tara:strand:+ start:187 stop:390 length:204 start_codon:yes stop_codon:yes gene_type:complete